MRGLFSSLSLFIFVLSIHMSTTLFAQSGMLTCTPTDAPSKGVCVAVQSMQGAEKKYYGEYGKNMQALEESGAGSLRNDLDTACGASVIKTAIEKCGNAADNAATACAESLSPNIQKGATLVKGAGALLGQVTGANDSCDGFADLMKNVGKAITAFEGACGGMKMACETTCEATSQAEILGTCGGAIKQAKTKVPEACKEKEDCIKEAGDALDAMEKSATTLSAAPTAVAKAADGYGLTLASAGAGLLSMANEGGKAKQCKDKTTANDCSKNPSAPGCGSAQTNIDCNGKDAQSSVCMCAKNPRQPGCDKTLQGTQFSHLVQQKPVTDTDAAAPALPGAPGYTPDFSGSQSSAGSAGGGGSGGGRTGFGGGSSAGSGADKSKPSGKGSELMMGGGGYGGGGGGGYGRGGGGYAEGKYDKYLPGGQEANRSVAGAGEVTGKMGKSNWDKIHDRYRDNVPKLKVDGR